MSRHTTRSSPSSMAAFVRPVRSCACLSVMEFDYRRARRPGEALMLDQAVAAVAESHRDRALSLDRQRRLDAVMAAARRWESADAAVKAARANRLSCSPRTPSMNGT
jgi:hypothetical protein